MDMKLPAGWRDTAPNDVGTLWILRYADHRARCALMACPTDAWELRVIVDGHLVLSQRCARGHAVFALAHDWEAKMTAVGWRRIPRDRRQLNLRPASEPCGRSGQGRPSVEQVPSGDRPSAASPRVLVPRFGY